MPYNKIMRLFCLLVLCLLPWPAASGDGVSGAAANTSHKQTRILVLYSYNYNHPAQALLAESLETARKTANIKTTDFLHEYLDITPPKFAGQRLALQDYLLKKYQGEQFELIITVFNSAFQFLLQEGQGLSPGTPCLALYNRKNEELKNPGRKVMQSPLAFDVHGTVKLALELFPRTTRIFFVSGAGSLDKTFEHRAREDSTFFPKNLKFEFSSNLALEDILARVKRLPPHTVVIYAHVTSDITGKNFVSKEIADRLAEAANAPMFCIATSHLDSGMIGGSLVDVLDLGAMLGRVIPSLITPNPLPLEPAEHFFKPMLNWPQLQRWNVHSSHMPADAVIIDRPPTLWGQYKTIVISAMVTIIVLICLITALIIQSLRRKKVEETARENEKQYRVLIERAPDAIGVYDVDLQRFVDVNPSAEKLFGCSRKELLRLPPFSFLRTEDLKENLNVFMPIYLKQILDGKELYQQWPLRSFDGRELITEVRMVRLPSEKNKLVRVSINDITKRKKAEEEQHAGEVFRNRVFDNSHIPIIVMDVETMTYVDCNPAAVKIYQAASREDVLGKSPGHFSTPLQYDGTLSETKSKMYLRQALRTGTAIFEWRLQRPNGEIWDALVHLMKFSDHGHDFIQFTLQDITEQKRSQDALQKTMKELQLILKNMINAFVVWESVFDEQGNYVSFRFKFFNDAYERIAKIKLEDVAGKDVFEVWPETERSWVEVYGKVATTGVPQTFEMYHKPTGGLFHCNAYRPWETKDLVCVIFEDITDRRSAEEEKSKLQDQLYQSQKMESVGRLAGGVAHDFNNMLGVILGFSEIILEKIDESHPFFSQLMEIHKAANRSAELTRQLLTFARKQQIEPKVLDLNATITGMLKMLGRLIGEDIELSWKPEDNLCPVKIDPSQIDQLLANLCVNARDAIQGVGKICIATQHIVFDEHSCSAYTDCSPGKYIMLSVSDTGSGMNREVQEHIFEPFFTTKESGQGTGLGLATVYGIVKQNEGFISVESEPGNGATFNIFLRCCEVEVKMEESTKKTDEYRGHEETILLVEDDPSTLLIGKMMLERLHYHVLSAESPEDALKLVKEADLPIALLVTDVVMPGMNGPELARMITAIHPGVKCLFCSGYTADVIEQRGMLDEKVLFIQKPYSIKELAKKVRQALSQ